MKTGDLVNFYTDAFPSANREYINPGIIINVNDSHRQISYTVLWGGGRITNETPGYLIKFRELDESR